MRISNIVDENRMKALGTFFLIALLAGGGWFFWNQKQGRVEAAAAGRPSTAEIETRDIRFAVSAAGEITPAEQVSVRPEVNGKIELLPVDVGDTVAQERLLFKLDDRELQTEKQSQETAVARTKLEIEQAERNYERSKELFEGKLVSQELFEDSKTAFELAKNSFDRAQRSLDLVLERLRKTVVVAPFDCTVLTRPVSIGQAVSGSGGFNSGTEVLSIANLNDLIINAHVNQADVTRLKVEQEVEVTVEAVPGLKIVGRVERIAPQATIKNNIKGFAARILLRNVDRRVRPGMTANISIPVASADNVVAAPLAAVFTEFNQETKRQERYAWVMAGGQWERRPITIGVSDYFFAEVTGGLKAGEVVSLEDRAKDPNRKPDPAISGKVGNHGGSAVEPSSTTKPQQASTR
jgi:HlyD family secretion protein